MTTAASCPMCKPRMTIAPVLGQIIDYEQSQSEIISTTKAMLILNELAWQQCDELAANAERVKVAVSHTAVGNRIIDCGVQAPGGLEAGRQLAEICLSGLGGVTIGPAGSREQPIVSVTTDQPWLACMASQYAGWQIAEGKFFAMASG